MVSTYHLFQHGHDLGDGDVHLPKRAGLRSSELARVEAEASLPSPKVMGETTDLAVGFKCHGKWGLDRSQMGIEARTTGG